MFLASINRFGLFSAFLVSAAAIIFDSAVPDIPHSDPNAVLVQLRECKSDDECFARRRCLLGWCEDFANHEYTTFQCSTDELCRLPLQGYFDTAPGSGQYYYRVVLQTIDSICGGSSFTPSDKYVGEPISVTVLTQTSAIVEIPPVEAYMSQGREQEVLGREQEMLGRELVGRLRVCGCPNLSISTDIRCSRSEDFIVPLGTLEYLDARPSLFHDLSNRLDRVPFDPVNVPFDSEDVPFDDWDDFELPDPPTVTGTSLYERNVEEASNVGATPRIDPSSPGIDAMDSSSVGFPSSDKSDLTHHNGRREVNHGSDVNNPDVVGLGDVSNETTNATTNTLLVLPTLVAHAQHIISPSFSVDFSKLKAKEMRILEMSGQQHQRSLLHGRILQSDGTLSSEIANRQNGTSRGALKSHGNECEEDTDCFSRFGKCEHGRCRGFDPDLTDDRLVRCVDGYRCNLKKGDIPGIDIGSDMQIIAISPSEKCGAVDPLKAEQSIFMNSNRWQCDDGERSSCVFMAGVGMRRNKTTTVEGVRLCGCPNVDGDLNGQSCDNRREFFVPLGRLSVQECIRNAHCINHELAYCVYDHCAGASGIAASAGLKVFQCVVSKNCNIGTLSTKALGEALKVLPIASNFGCGAESALDPDFIDDAALPCVVDINDDGVCDINLGIAKVMGTTRLCGCSGDKGGNGRACDQLEDFDSDMGTVNVNECIVDVDCGMKKGEVCIDGRCVEDRFPPYVVRSFPGNQSYAVPPVNEVSLLWNENIQFTKTGRKLIIASTDVDDPRKWEMEVRDPSTYKISQAGYSITIKGREMKIIPDISMSSFSEGKYVVGYEGGIVADLQDNFNRGAIDVMFTISKSVGCPYMYVTGYSTTEVNPNGLYTAVEPINGHSAWRGGAHNPLYIYWKEREAKKNQPGNWIISSKTDERHFIAYADLDMMKKLGREGEIRPPGGIWKKWETDQWLEHPEITVTCKETFDRTFPKLIEIYPKIGATSVETNATRVMMRFSKPVTYGHWANIVFSARDDPQNITVIPDFEAGMRRKNIKSDMQGVVELNLDGLGNLKSGTTYDIIAELGCLTDLSYNPWGPVGEGVLYFTTYGVSCSDFPDLGPAYITKGSKTSHGDFYSVSCASDYTSPVRNDDDDDEDSDEQPESNDTIATDSSRVIRCVDGTWEEIQLVCSKDCPRYYELGPQYKVEGDTGVNHHGTLLNVTCAEETVVIEGTGSGQTRCNNGKWEALPLKCGATCGPFPSLGASYDVQYDNSSSISSTGSLVVGARRIVRCAKPALAVSGTEPEFVVCEEKGWSQVALKCFIPCGELPSYTEGYTISDEESAHSQSRNLTCASGYEAFPGGPTFAIVKCNEGRWEQNRELKCMRDCGKFSGGTGYTVTPKTGTYGSYGSTIEIQCADEAIRQSRETSEVLSCEDGQWQLAQVVCMGPCDRPEVSLGRSYVSELQRSIEKTASGRYPHGTTGYLYCSASSNIVSGIPPEYIICNNGFWISANGGEMSNPSRADYQAEQNRPTLTCQSGCGPFSKDTQRYQDVGGVDVNRELALRPVTSGATRMIECVKGYSPEPPAASNTQLTCQDGKWLESKGSRFTCLSVCSQSVIASLFEKNYELVDPRRISAHHGESFDAKCRSGLSKRIGAVGQKEEETAAVTCINGRLKLPTFICSQPTCTDGILNGDEEGIDCGGTCPSSCTPCQLGSPSCVPTCRDRVKNGDEEGVDCGGTSCDPCKFCNGPPINIAEGMAMSNDGGATILSTREMLKKQLMTGVQFDVFCAEGYEQLSSAPISRFQTYECQGQPPQWRLSDGSRTLALLCGAPRCDDGIQNGGEWGVDCGGSCPNACPTCNDGIKNGDEESIDCGGSHCLPCRNCGVGSFKSLNVDVVKIEIVSSSLSSEQQSTELKELWDLKGTDHGDRRKVSCRDPITSYSLLRCDNGDWTSVGGAPSIYHLNCNGGAVDQIDLTNLAGSQFQTFRIPELPIPYSCSKSDDPKKDIKRDSQCCQLIPSLQLFLSSECGALLYSSKSSQVAGFCTGACFTRLTTLLQGYQATRCDALSYLEAMKEIFCATGTKPPNSGGLSAHSSSNDFRCFAAAGQTLSQMKDLVELRGPGLTAACEPKSCFSSNLHYFEILRDLNVLSSQTNLTAASSHRNLRDVTFDEVEAAMASSLDSLTTLTTRIVDAFTKGVLTSTTQLPDLISRLAELTPTGQLEQSRTDEETENRQLGRRELGRRELGSGEVDEISGFVASSASSPAVRELLIVNRYSRSLLKFMCFTDGDGNSCGPTVQSIVTNDPSSKNSKNLKNSTSLAPPPASSSRLGSSMKPPCADKCILEVTRHMGQSLYSTGKEKVDPYMAILGLLMRAYGRVACQKSTTGMNCGDLFGPTLNGSAMTVSDTDERRKKYPDCTCPLAYIGDGHCDTVCFNPDCNYDESDCLFKTMFPSMSQRFDLSLPSSDRCHPFNSEFDCSSTYSSSSRAAAECRNKVTGVLESDGCCAATRWEILREVLNLEVTMRRISASRYELNTGKKASEFIPSPPPTSSFSLSNKKSNPLVLDRSSSWIETSCQVSLDRSCSRGLRRSIVHSELTLRNLNYQRIFASSDSKFLSNLLIIHLRSKFSDLLAVPIADIGEMRFWSGSVFVEVVVDAGASLSEILKDLKNLEATGAIKTSINSAAKDFLKDAINAGIPLSSLLDRSDNRRLQETNGATLLDDISAMDFVEDFKFDLHPIQLPALSITNGPATPITGTLDMPGFSSSLLNPPCSNFLGLSPPPDFHASESLVYEIDQTYGRSTTHGSTRQVRCANDYEPSLENSGHSPQFLVCDRGRWVTPTPGERQLVCRKACVAYESLDVGFDLNDMSIVAEGGQRDGATRTVSCLAGFQPVDGGKSPEVLRCRNGVWDRRSLACIKGDGSNRVLMNAVCGQTVLSDIMVPRDVYMLKEILSSTIDALDLQTSNSPKAPTKLTLWSAHCTRGYIAKEGNDPVALVCVNDTLLASPNFDVPDWEKMTPRGDGSDAISAKNKHLDAKQREILHLYYDYKTQAKSDTIGINIGDRFTMMECKADVRTPPRIASTQPGLANPAFFSIVFASAFTVIALGLLAFYMRKTRCMKRSFFDHHHGGFDGQQNSNKGVKDKGSGNRGSENKIPDIHHTGPGDDESASPTSSSQAQSELPHRDDEYESYRHADCEMKLGSRDQRSSQEALGRVSSGRYGSDIGARYSSGYPSRQERGGGRPGRRRRREEREYSPSFDEDVDLNEDDVFNEVNESRVQQTIDRAGRRDVRLSSLRREYHQVAAVHETSLLSVHSPSPLPMDARALRIRGGNQRRAMSFRPIISSAHPINSSIQWSEIDESDFDCSDETSAPSYSEVFSRAENLSRRRNNKNHHSDYRETHLPPPLGRRSGASALETDDEEQCESVADGSVIESGASYYSEVELDPERLRDYHSRFPDFNRRMINDLIHWSKTRTLRNEKTGDFNFESNYVKEEEGASVKNVNAPNIPNIQVPNIQVPNIDHDSRDGENRNNNSLPVGGLPNISPIAVDRTGGEACN